MNDNHLMICAANLSEFTNRVNERLAQGYQPYGPPAIAASAVSGSEGYSTIFYGSYQFYGCQILIEPKSRPSDENNN